MMFERLSLLPVQIQQQTLMAPDIHQSPLCFMGLQPADPFILWLRHLIIGALSSIFHSRSAALSRAL